MYTHLHNVSMQHALLYTRVLGQQIRLYVIEVTMAIASTILISLKVPGSRLLVLSGILGLLRHMIWLKFGYLPRYRLGLFLKVCVL